MTKDEIRRKYLVTTDADVAAVLRSAFAVEDQNGTAVKDIGWMGENEPNLSLIRKAYAAYRRELEHYQPKETTE
jgi:hypothetical protein